MSYFIVLEGLNKTGKTTLLPLIKKKLQKQLNIKVGTYKDPTIYGVFNDFYKYLSDNTVPDLSTFLLFLANRIYGYENILKPSLIENDIVITDRYYYSTLTYQVYSKEFNYYDKQYLIQINNLVNRLANLSQPNLVFYFKFNPTRENLLLLDSRKEDKPKDLLEDVDIEKRIKISNGFDVQFKDSKIVHNINPFDNLETNLEIIVDIIMQNYSKGNFNASKSN